MNQALAIPTGIVLVATLISAVTDLWKMKVYNVLTLPLILSGLIYHGIWAGVVGLSESCMGLLFGFSVLIVPHLLGLLGAGDVKLMAGVGAWLGIPEIIYVFAVSSLAAGLYAVIVLAASGRLMETIVNLQLIWYRLLSIRQYVTADSVVQARTKDRNQPRLLIPFAAMVAVGVLLTLFGPQWTQ